jgi:hypothetical protein
MSPGTILLNWWNGVKTGMMKNQRKTGESAANQTLEKEIPSEKLNVRKRY